MRIVIDYEHAKEIIAEQDVTIERLRAALERIEKMKYDEKWQLWDASEIAREALQEGE